jgi:hypothetical protein
MERLSTFDNNTQRLFIPKGFGGYSSLSIFQYSIIIYASLISTPRNGGADQAKVIKYY